MEDELIKKLEALQPENIEVPSHREGLKKFLLQTGLDKKGLDHSFIKTGLPVKVTPFSYRVYKPALASLAILTVITLVMVSMLANPQSEISANDIALNDPQVRTALNAEPAGIKTEELADDGANTKVVLLSSDSNTVIVVDMTARKVTQWLYNSAGYSAIETASPSGTKYQLFFSSNMNGLSSIFIVNTDGTRLAKLTQNDGYYSQVSWSPASQKIAFISNRKGNSQLYVSNADGADIKQLTNFFSTLDPAWSPDGSQVAFSASAEGDYEIFVINADGSNLIKLTNDVSNHFNPSWSPNGQKIVFESNIDGSWEIYTINADGSNLQNLSQNAAIDTGGTFSPDGLKIAFSSTRQGNYDVYIVNTDGSGLMNLTDDTANDNRPTWSPDGQKIAFYSDRDGDSEIYVMNADGSNLAKLTDNDIPDNAPSWSPDGSKIAFFSKTDEMYDLYIMNSDGTNRTKLAEQVIYQPRWAQLTVYPVPDVPQNEIVTPLPLTAIPVTMVTLGALSTAPPAESSPTTIPPPTSVWPVSSKEQAIAIATRYLPVEVTSQATVRAAFGWSGPGFAVGEPRWMVTFSGISITKEKLGWEQRHEVTKIGEYWVLILPSVEFQGEGPYNEIYIIISGLDGNVRYQRALITALFN
jgi:Tol biopolymer transport system component